MATTTEKQQLVDDIKRPVRYYRIALWGQGADYMLDQCTAQEYDYWATNAEERIAEFGVVEYEDPFRAYMSEKDTDEKWNSVPKQFRRKWDYYEYNLVDAVVGVEQSFAKVEILELENNISGNYTEIINTVVDNMIFDEFLYQVDCEYIVGDSDTADHPYIYSAISKENGIFYETVIETQGHIDLTKLCFHATEMHNGSIIIHDIYYDGEYLDNKTSGTDCKSLDIKLINLETICKLDK